MRSLANVFPDRTIELGGELIDFWHKVMLKYARRFGLTLIDLFKTAGEVVYRIDGETYPESVIIDAFREVVLRMASDVRSLTSGLNARIPFTARDEELDFTNLDEYLVSIGSDPLLLKAIRSVFGGEYGQAIDRQSCLNFIFFAKLSRSQSRIVYFGANNAERYAIVEGNDAIAKGLEADLTSPVQFGMDLRAIRQADDGRFVLTFGKKTERLHHAVVLAIPATVIRSRVDLHANLDIAPETRAAIQTLQYGDNTKTMYQFASAAPFAGEFEGDGTSYVTDPALPNIQVTFPSKTGSAGADPTKPVIVDYGFGVRGRDLTRLDRNGEKFLQDLDVVFPGARAQRRQLLDGSLFKRAHWPSEPNALGSYTCNQPGYFTTEEGWLGEPAGNLTFAGEHTDSFYNFQGFIEGAAESGIRAAEYLLDRIRGGAL